ncbi:kazrin [Crotalus adamanteus]|uniref:Kazrin n=1 Tax=Crotalus adamanteus TaxID=8729 RepID=A0AAW1AQG7_CROAD
MQGSTAQALPAEAQEKNHFLAALQNKIRKELSVSPPPKEDEEIGTGLAVLGSVTGGLPTFPGRDESEGGGADGLKAAGLLWLLRWMAWMAGEALSLSGEPTAPLPASHRPHPTRPKPAKSGQEPGRGGPFSWLACRSCPPSVGALGAGPPPASQVSLEEVVLFGLHFAPGRPSWLLLWKRWTPHPDKRHGTHVTLACFSLPVLLREEVSQLQEEIHLLRQMKDTLTKDLEETHGGKAAEILPATELRVQLAQKEEELARAKEALQAMKADRRRLKGEKSDLVSQMQQLYSTLESREEQLRDFIRNYEQHRKESEDAVKALAKEKDLLEREKWELRRQAKEATDHAGALRSQLDLKDNRMKELEAELAMAKQSLATLTKDVPKRHSLAMPGETVLNGNQEWVMQADLPLTAAIRQSQQTLYHAHPQHTMDRQGVRVSPCHSRQPSIISDASAAEGDRSSTPSDINSPRHRTHSLCNGDSPGPVQKNLHNPIVQSLEDLEDQKRKKKKEKMGFGSISRVFARGKQRKSLDPGVFDGAAPDYYIEEDADW